MSKKVNKIFLYLHDQIRNYSVCSSGTRFETMDGRILIYEHPLGNMVVDYRFDEYRTLLIYTDDTVCAGVPGSPISTHADYHVEKTIVIPTEEEIAQLIWLLDRSEPKPHNPDMSENNENPDDYLISLRRVHRHVDQLPICEQIREQGLTVFTQQYASLVENDEYANWFVLTVAEANAKNLSEAKIIITWRNTIRLLETWDDDGHWHIYKLGYDKVVNTVERILVEKFSKEG